MEIKQAVLSELDSLPEARQADVLVFIRFLKIGLMDAQEAEQRFDEALAQARAIAAQRGVTEQTIADEVRAFRSEA